MSRQEHWEAVYAAKEPSQVSWFRPHLDRSVAWIEGLGLDSGAHIVDVGAGASTLVDDLLARGFVRISALDLSAQALARSQARLGEEAADRVRWIVGDATEALLEADSVDLWHDRAVFHFLTEEAQRAAYVAQLARALRVGGVVILATFAPDGPERCSGLPVARHSVASLREALGPAFVLLDEAREVHETPWGSPQVFTYAMFRRGGV
jgi:SAM-dependent methyltransferase